MQSAWFVTDKGVGALEFADDEDDVPIIDSTKPVVIGETVAPIGESVEPVDPLEFMMSLHRDSTARVDAMEEDAARRRGQFKFTYFSESDSGKEEPEQADRRERTRFRMQKVPNIDLERWQELNAKSAPRAPVEAMEVPTRTITRRPDDFLALNRRQEQPPREAHIEPVEKPVRRPNYLPVYEWSAVPEKPPSCYSRKPEERPPRKAKPRARRKPVEAKWQPLEKVDGAPIPKHDPSMVRHPERYTREAIREALRKRQGSAGELPVDVPGEEATGSPVELRDDDNRTLEDYLASLKDGGEWPGNVPGQPPITEEAEQVGVPRRGPVIDPHETRAVRLRNQAVQELLALRELRRELQEADAGERHATRRRIAKEISPRIRQLDREQAQRMGRGAEDSTEARAEAARADWATRAGQLREVCDVVKAADFLVARETRRLDPVEQQNRDAKERRKGRNSAEQAMRQGRADAYRRAHDWS